MCQCLRCDFCRSTQRERCKFHSLLGSVGKLSARQTLTFQPLPSITSVESAKIWKTRDQPKPGSLFGKMRDLGNEVAGVSESSSGPRADSRVRRKWSNQKWYEQIFCFHCVRLKNFILSKECWSMLQNSTHRPVQANRRGALRSRGKVNKVGRAL